MGCFEKLLALYRSILSFRRKPASETTKDLAAHTSFSTTSSDFDLFFKQWIGGSHLQSDGNEPSPDIFRLYR